MNRREALNSLAGALAASALRPNGGSSTTAPVVDRRPREPQSGRQPYVGTGDGTLLFLPGLGYREIHSFHPQHLLEFPEMAIQHGSFI